MQDDDLAQVVEVLAQSWATEYDVPIDQARLHIGGLVRRARQQYRRSGAVYGDTAAGFLSWKLDPQRLRRRRKGR